MKFSEKMCFEIILNVTKKQAYTLSLEDTFFEKPQEWVYLTPAGILGLNSVML